MTVPVKSHPGEWERWRYWPLAGVLSLQAGLSLCVPMNTHGPSNDEALYLTVGRLELSHWLHGTNSPSVAQFFSGAPVLYPPVGAVANGIAGLGGARLLSLIFMLAATVFLWLVASKLCGRLAALCGALLFGVLPSTLHVGSLATYDAMALLFMGISTWCAFHMGRRWLILSGVALVIANSTKYASALFDPIVICTAVLYIRRSAGGRVAIVRGVWLSLGVLVSLALLLSVAGPDYWRGLKMTTLSRHQSIDSVSQVLSHALGWSWVILVLALIGVGLNCFNRQPGSSTSLLVIFALGGVLAPAEQARIHTLLSLDKHIAFGAWFAAVPAGYALGHLIVNLSFHLPVRGGPMSYGKSIVSGACLVLIVPLAILGWVQGREMAGYSRTAHLIPVLRPLTARGGSFLSDTARADAYGLPTVPWTSWTKLQSKETLVRTQGLAGQILRGKFSLVVMSAGRIGTPQAQLRAVLDQDSSYRLVTRVSANGPGDEKFLIWQLRGR